MLYTQAYNDFCERNILRHLNSMDEMTSWDKKYGQSKRGYPCIEIGRTISDRKNLFVAYHCVLYFDFVDDSSNMHRNIFEFLDEALLKQYEFGRSWLFPGDVVIVYLKKNL